MEVTYPKRCGNAPRKKILVSLYEAFAEKDFDFISEYLADEIIWERLGTKTVAEKDNVESAYRNIDSSEIKEIQIDETITHGNVAAVYGNIILADEKIAFCDVYKFKGHSKTAKIKEIKSFVIPVKQD